MVDDLPTKRILEFVEIGLHEVHPRVQCGKQPRALRIHDFQRLGIHGAEKDAVIFRVHAAGQTAGNDRHVASCREHLHHIQKLVRLAFADLFADVVDFGEHGFVVDELIILANPPLFQTNVNGTPSLSSAFSNI